MACRAWAGKSALLSTFVLHPPAGVDVVAFFVSARLAAESDSTAFTNALIDQLAALTRKTAPATAITPAARDALCRDLLGAAFDHCGQTGRRLVIIVDGVDDYRGVGANA